VAVKIRLKRMGKIRAPYYRIVVADSRTKRDGRVIEEIGKYHPKQEPSLIEVASDRAQYWLGVGAQPTEAVTAILKVTGDWQRFKGEAGAEGTLRVAEPRKSKQEIFNEILKESGGASSAEAVTRRTAAKRAAEKPAQRSADKPADETPAEAAPPAEQTAVDQTPEGAAQNAEAAADAADGSAPSAGSEA
jgi:small subunit ribosomal protein S16